MIPAALSSDLATVVRRSFCQAEDFACLTGSMAAGNATTSSDIDVVVVLPDSLPLPAARAGRERFTRAYIDLHARHDRAPDLDWPGEVLYARDLGAACHGAAFDLGQLGHELPLSPEEVSYRYWVSMIASGHAITGAAPFLEGATRCADVMVQHVLCRMRRSDTVLPDVPTVLAHTAWDTDWHIPQTPHSPAWPRLARRAHQLLASCEETLDRQLTEWAHALRETPQLPVLDENIDQWRRIACDPAIPA